MRVFRSLGLFGIFLAAITTHAAVSKSSREASVPEVSVKELLSLPEKNRLAVAEVQQKPNLYSDLLSMAFNPTERFQMRWKALTLAASLRGAPASPEIQKACESAEWYMRNACLLALDQIDRPKAIEYSKKLISDKALVVRSAAVRVLATQLNPKNRDLLWEELDKSYNFRMKQSLWVRGEILEVLSKSPTKEETSFFAKTLRDKDSRLHVYAIRALEKIEHKRLGAPNATLSAKRELWLKTIR